MQAPEQRDRWQEKLDYAVVDTLREFVRWNGDVTLGDLIHMASDLNVPVGGLLNYLAREKEIQWVLHKQWKQMKHKDKVRLREFVLSQPSRYDAFTIQKRKEQYAKEVNGGNISPAGVG